MTYTMRWTPGHKGTPGNEREDGEAKRAARGESTPNHRLPLHCRGTLPISKSAAIQHYLKKLKKEATEMLSKSPRYQRIQELNPSAPSSKFQKITAPLLR